MPIKLAVFDMAGTTVYDNNNVADAFKNAFDAFHIETGAVNLNHLMGYKKTEAIESALRQIEWPFDEELVNSIYQRFVINMSDHYETSDDIHALPFAEELFGILRAREIKIALNTGFSNDIATLLVKRLGWNSLVDDYISSSEVISGRPSPLMIRELMRRAGCNTADDVLKVGDTESDINEGRNAGCGLVVAVTTGAYTRAELVKFAPDFVIDHLSELLPIIDDFE